MFVAFVIRLVGYALVFGIVSRLAQMWWTGHGLDGIAALQPFHDAGMTTLLVAPVILALVGAGAMRPLAVFVAGVLAGAALTAPFVIAIAAGI